MATATATVQTAPQPSSIHTRPLRGSRISTFYPVKKSTTLPLLNSLNSAFQLQEYISLVIRQDVHDVERIVSLPSAGNGAGSAKGKEKEEENKDEKEGEQESAESKEKQPEVSVDEACWKYEQLRRLAQDLSHPLITSLQQVCTRATCPEMKAGEWLYLCVAHGNDGAMEQCCAIDYILHTLDSATALLNSPRAFPSRLQIEPSSHRHFSSLARRLGRIFAHAYFHHREEFEQAEAESSLYARFLALTEKFDLVPADFLVIPPRVGEGNVNNANNDDRRGNLGPAGATEVAEPTLLGASLQVTTQEPTHLESGSGSGNSSPDSALSPGGTGTRRFGRSRTDTMMLEGEGRFPASPLSAAEDGPRLDSVLALAEAELGATKQTHPEEHQTHEQPAELDIEQDDDHDEDEDKSAEDAHSFIAAGLPAHDPELEPESPPGDGSTGTGLAPEPPSPQGDVMPVVTPSSSTSTAALPLVLPAKEPIEVIQVNSDGEDDGESKEEKVEEVIAETQSADVPATAEKDLAVMTEPEAVAGVVPPAEVEVETVEKVEQPAVEQVVATPEPAPVGENVQEADVTEEKAE